MPNNTAAQRPMDLTQIFSRRPRVVVADDDWLNRDLLKACLLEAGCEVHDYADGQRAWEAIQTIAPDLALLDIMMPQLDGLSLCRQIRSSPRTRFIPVIIVTALDDEDEKLRAIEVGADDFIGKPFNMVILLTRVRSLLIKKHLHDELDSRNRLLRQVLNRYVDQDLAEVILTDPERHLKLGGETRQVTVLFADLRGFTDFAARHPASRVVETVNRVFEELTHVIFDHGGTFDKFLGDAILAFYGAPFRSADDAQRALCTALEMQARFAELQGRSPKTPLADLQGLGIGVHSGEAIVGNIGSERVMDYTVIGDTVNVARRLQEAALPGEILISGETLASVPAAVAEEAAASRQLKSSLPVRVFSLHSLTRARGCAQPPKTRGQR